MAEGDPDGVGDVAIGRIFGAESGPLDQFVAWLEQARPVGVERIVALSSMSAASKHASPDPAERELAARLVASEQRLARYCRDGGIAWCVLRPTLIYGAGVDRSLSPIARWARQLRLFPCLPAATGLRQPVHADDVAAACVAALEEADGEVYELGGGERLSYAAMLARLRDSLDRRTLAVPLPIYLLRMLARLTGRGNGMVQRLTQDLIADNSPVERRFGLRPRPFRPRAECWRSASSPSDP